MMMMMMTVIDDKDDNDYDDEDSFSKIKPKIIIHKNIITCNFR